MSAERRALPSGRVTFAFIDVVGSTLMFQEHGQRYAEALQALHAQVAASAEVQGGVVVETEGDGAFLAFPDAVSAVTSLAELQGRLEDKSREGLRLRIRAGAHAGDAEPVGGHYLALAVYVAARVAATANAGQLFVTDEVVEELSQQASEFLERAADVGTYSLKDLAAPTRIWRVVGDTTPPRATPARRTNVQLTHTSFVGRADELAELTRLLDAPGLVTVRGPGGTGKTRLVSELALRDAEGIPGGMWLVELATLDDPEHLDSFAGAALGMTGASRDGLVAELDRRGRCVLLLDNCEHLTESVSALVEDLLSACRSLTVLATSREALVLPGERVFVLAPFSVLTDATDLFLQRSATSLSREIDRELVELLCTALDGLPLAIELAAAQAQSVPLREIYDEVVAGSAALARRGGESRQRSLDTVLDWSLGRLQAATRNSLLVLAMFPGRFSPATARTLLEAAPACDPDATRTLAGLSLIDLDGDDYRLLSTVRAAALRLLSHDPDVNDQAINALIIWAIAYADERFPIISAHEDVPDDTWFALEEALRLGMSSGTSGLGKVWDLFMVLTSNRGSGPAAVELTQRAAEREPDDVDAVYQLTAAVQLLHILGHSLTVHDARLEKMRTIAQNANDPRLTERVLAALGAAADALGEYEKGLHARLEVLRLTETIAELRPLQAMTLGHLSFNRWLAGDVDSAEAFARRSAAVAAEDGQWVVFATETVNVGEFVFDKGQYTQARDLALLALQRSQPSWVNHVHALVVLARSYAALGSRDEALAVGGLALESLTQSSMSSARHDPLLDELLTSVPELKESATVRPRRPTRAR